MTNHTERGNIVTPTDVISDRASAALVKKVVVLPLIYAENLSPTGVKKWRKRGSLTAEQVAESTAYSFSASSEYTETAVTATVQKNMVSSKLTREARDFTDMDALRLADEQGAAIARDLDDDILALFSGFSTQVTATSTLTVNDLMDGAYNVKAGEAGRVGANLIAVLDYKGVNEIKKELKDSGAAAFGNESMISLLMGADMGNGFAGSLPGIDVYETSGLPTSGGDDVGLVFNPEMAFGGMYGEVQTEVVFKGSEGVYDEITSYVFNQVIEWNDAAGCGVLSGT